MGERQTASIGQAIRTVYASVRANDEATGMCCTFETRAASGDDRWIQVLRGNVNAQYLYQDEPVARLAALGVRVPLGVSTIDWSAGMYATFDVTGLEERDVTFFVDQLFVKALGCDDDAYELTTNFEDLDD